MITFEKRFGPVRRQVELCADALRTVAAATDTFRDLSVRFDGERFNLVLGMAVRTSGRIANTGGHCRAVYAYSPIPLLLIVAVAACFRLSRKVQPRRPRRASQHLVVAMTVFASSRIRSTCFQRQPMDARTIGRCLLLVAALAVNRRGSDFVVGMFGSDIIVTTGASVRAVYGPEELGRINME